MLNTKFRNRSGMTLLEIIMAIAIFSIVMALIFSILKFSNKSFALGVNQSSVQSETRLVTEYVLSSVRFSTELAVDNVDTELVDISTLDPSYNYVYLHDQTLYHLISAQSSHKIQKLGTGLSSVNFSLTQDTLVLSLEGFEDEQTFSIQADVDLPNVRLGNSIITDNSGNFMKYKSDINSEVINENYIIVIHERPMFFITDNSSRQIEFDIIPELHGYTESYTSSDPTVANVDSVGNVSPFSEGVTSIKLSIEKDGLIMEADIPVYVMSDSLSVSISPEAPIEIPSMSSLQLNYSVDGLVPGSMIINREWSSSDTSFLTVDHTGLVKSAAIPVAAEAIVSIVIATDNGMYGMASVAIKVLPAIQLPRPIVKIVSTGSNKGIFITEAFIGATVKVEAMKNNAAWLPYAEGLIDETGTIEFPYDSSQKYYKITLSMEGYVDSEPVEN